MTDDVSQRKTLKSLLSDILRPQVLSDLTLPTRTIRALERAMTSGSIVNMLFHGPLGSGKTSAARILMDAIGKDMTINRSSETRPRLAERIESFVYRCRGKIVFIDEAQFISTRDQRVLPDIIDCFSRECLFFVAATEIKKLIPTLRSRLMEISFEVAPEDREEVQKRLMERYENMLPANGYRLDKLRLEQIIEANFPDLRSIANNIEFGFG
jgi:replication-associated recombination protein RarA